MLEQGQLLDNGRYEVLKQIKGGFCSNIYVLKNKNVDLECLLKLNLSHEEVKKQEIPEAVYEYTKKDHIERTFHELEMLRKFNHPNIAQVVDTLTIGNNLGLIFHLRGSETLKNIIPLNHLGSIFGPAHDTFSYFREARYALNFAKSFLDAVDTMSFENILHGDLHPGNIIMDNGKPIIIDFGFSSPVDCYDGVWGSRTYAPPEVYTGRVNLDSDYWHVGLILYEILAKEHLINNSKDPNEKRNKIIEKVKKLNDPKYAVEFYEELIDKFSTLREKYIENINQFDYLKLDEERIIKLESYSEWVRILKNTNDSYSRIKSYDEIMFEALIQDDMYFDFMKKTYNLNFEKKHDWKNGFLNSLTKLLETAAYCCQPQHLLPGEFAYPTKRGESLRLKEYLEHDWPGVSKNEPFELVKKKMEILKRTIH